VAPPGFIGGMAVHPMEVWVPTATASGRVSAVLRGMDLGSRRDAWARLVGRLAPGMTVEEAQRDLAGVAAILEATHPANQGRTLRILPGAGMTPEERAEASRVPRLLAMAVAILLLIACGNVASLSLVRAAARRRELATRLALGASRAGLVRQVALEGTLIAVGAGILGIVIARLLVRSAVIVGSFAAVSNPDLSMDRRVLIVALAAAALTAIIVSLVPALQVLRVPAAAVLKDGGRSLRRRMGQRALVSAQVGASLVLLYGAAIVFTAFQRLLAAHDGVEPRRLTDIAIRSGTSGIDTASVSRFYREVLARAAAEPVVAGAALTTNIPPFEWASHATVFRRGEEPPREALVGRELELGWRVDMIPVSPGFFDVVRLPLVRGRDFDAGDTPASARVAIVSRAMADAMWPRMDAIGRFIAWPSVEGPVRVPLLVVGVAEDGRTVTGGGAPPAMYVPFTQQPATNLVLVVRSRGDAPVAPTTLRRIVASVNARVPVQGGRTLEDRLSGAVRPQRTASAWIGVFGAIALVLAGVGLYGVVAQAVLQRTRELALRCALGATPVGILRLVLDDGMRVAAAGAAVGIAGVAVSFRVLRSMLSGLGGVDGGSAVFAMAILGLAMLIATYLPARRAARLDPAAALRAD
jgi:predicted permease